jgi:hypothetical protein
MKVTDEYVQVSSETRAVDGTKLEPEEIEARQVFVSPMTVSMGSSALDGTPTGATMDAKLNLDSTMGNLARAAGTYCGYCEHFDIPAWLELKKAWEETRNPELDALRGQLMDGGSGTIGTGKQLSALTQEAELMLRGMGICHALTEIIRDAVIVAPNASCPQGRGPNDEDLSQNFKPKDKEVRRFCSKRFDEVMRVAQGRK